MTHDTPHNVERLRTVDDLAQAIRRVDGNHSLGAGALAEALWPSLAALQPDRPGSHLAVTDEMVERDWSEIPNRHTDDAHPVNVLAGVLFCAEHWVPEARIIGNVRAGDIARAIRAFSPERLAALNQAPAADAGEPLAEQVERLANFIMAEVPGEPSQSEGAIDTAIRWMRSRLATPTSPTGETAVREALPEDLFTHSAAWRRGLVALRDAGCVSGPDIDDRAYWQHEIDAFDRVFASLPSEENGWLVKIVGERLTDLGRRALSGEA